MQIPTDRPGMLLGMSHSNPKACRPEFWGQEEIGTPRFLAEVGSLAGCAGGGCAGGPWVGGRGQRCPLSQGQASAPGLAILRGKKPKQEEKKREPPPQEN